MFQLLFERSADAIWLFDPQAGVFVDCNSAAVDWFEWVGRRFDGQELPLEITATMIVMGGKKLNLVISRDISERKSAEAALVELNQSLERRVAERTAELETSEARFRALVEHAPEAIVVFDGDTGRFLFGNEHACILYGVPMERLTELTPAEVSPEFQPGGRRSSELAREKMDEALAGGTPIFDWIHQQPDGWLIPTEVRLLRLPAEGQNLVRASIIDNTGRKRTEQALRESEEKFRALFEGSSQGVILQDEKQYLEANPAAVRIMGCQTPQELLGKHPSDTSPPFQPNGESSAVLARNYIQECMTNGSARFEWVCRTPQGKDVPLEVALTRIQWSGRQVIQALINDITERKQAEHALREANRELRREIEQRTRAEESLKERVRMSTLNAEVAVALNAGTELRDMLQQCAELVVRHLDVAFVRVWTLDEATQTLGPQATAGCYTHHYGPHRHVKVGEYKIGLIAQEKKPHLTNNVQSDPRVRDKEWAAREGMVAFAGYPLLLEDRVLGVLALFARRPLADDVLKALGSVADSIALGIERKRAQTALAESEARFSVAFQASPIFIAILRMSDGRFVLVNDAFVTWAGHSREQILGRSTTELSVWERQEDREAYWAELRRAGSIRARECRFRNHSGRVFTMLLSSEVIQLNRVPHILSLALDITERKQTEAELRTSEARLRESEARFSVAFQASPVFINMIRMSDGAYVLANDAFVNWLGYSREEVLGHTSAELGMWESLDERDQAWKDMRGIGSIRQRECRWLNRSGQQFTILLSAETIQVNGTPHILSLALDITQRKRAEVELLKTLEREKELSQLKSNFVSMVSHEFRTPLAIIQTSAELLREFYQKMQPAERDEQLESITGNTAGKLDFRPAALELDAFCRCVVDEVLSATSRRCTIEFSLAAALPPARADERLLEHIFTNLLSNAVKYSEPGACVRFAVERDSAEAICVIRDEGIGISKDDQEMLFTAFHRGANVGNRAGTGLGLLLVKRCVELHRGKVRIESKVGHGTTVIVRLPVFETNK